MRGPELKFIELADIPEERIFALAERLDRRGPRYTSYPTVPVWKTDFPAERFEGALQRLGGSGKPFSLYVHLPFCRQRCLYCGCNSFVTHDRDRMTAYLEALGVEMERVCERLPAGARHGRLHLGGGTPTHIPAALLSAFLDRLIEKIPGAAECERSVEVDPRVTTSDHLFLLIERGFKRISIGLQDLDTQVQQAVNRGFTLEQTEDFTARARAAGFMSINFDLIYGLPRQTRRSWKKTLKKILKLRPERAACFGYAHLPSLFTHQQALQEETLPAPRERLGMLLDAHRFFTSHGWEAVGFDHFALPDDYLARARREGSLWRNFMGYTPGRGSELLGLGCSAISEFEELFSQNLVSPDAYVKAIWSDKWAVHRGHLLDAEDQVRKRIITQLMCNLEISMPEAVTDGGGALAESLRRAVDSLKPFEEEGLIASWNGGYAVTPLGQLFLRNLAMPFDGYLPDQGADSFSRTI